MNKEQGFLLIELTIVLIIIGLIISPMLLLYDGKDTQLADNNITYRNDRLYILTDSETGCEYLSAWDGGITPRMNNDGEHICRKGKENNE